MATPICGIYTITHIASGRCYVGSSAHIYQRWYGHRSSLNRTRHQSRVLQDDWLQYGAEAFRFDVLEKCAAVDLFPREQHYIDTLKPVYNNSSRAGYVTYTPEVRAKMSAKAKARPRRPHSPETCAKLVERAQARRAQTSVTMAAIAAQRPADYYDKFLTASHTPEARLRISTALRGKQNRLGQTNTPEHRAKISAANKGHHRNLGSTRSPETKVRMAAAHRARYAGSYVVSAETRAKMSAASSGRVASPETRAKIPAARMGNQNARRDRATTVSAP